MSTIIPKLSQTSRSIWRILGCNPSSFTLQGTNVYLVGRGKERILIDAGPYGEDEFIENIRKVLRNQKCVVKHLILTHWHLDHVGALGELISVFKDECQELPHVYKFEGFDIGIPREYVFEELKDGQIFEVEGVTMKTLHTPGHTSDHACLHYLEENIIFCGDAMLGEGTGIFEDLSEYLKSLEIIRRCKSSKILPAHGPIIHDSIERVTYYINHQLIREKRVYDCLFDSAPRALSISDITEKLYSGLSANTQNQAREGIRHHVNKLIREKKIQEKRGKYYIDDGF